MEPYCHGEFPAPVPDPLRTPGRYPFLSPSVRCASTLKSPVPAHCARPPARGERPARPDRPPHGDAYEPPPQKVPEYTAGVKLMWAEAGAWTSIRTCAHCPARIDETPSTVT